MYGGNQRWGTAEEQEGKMRRRGRRRRRRWGHIGGWPPPVLQHTVVEAEQHETGEATFDPTRDTSCWAPEWKRLCSGFANLALKEKLLLLVMVGCHFVIFWESLGATLMCVIVGSARHDGMSISHVTKKGRLFPLRMRATCTFSNCGSNLRIVWL